MKKVLIFGANRGIGLSLAKHYKDQGFDVTTINRSKTQELESLGTKNFFGVDVSNIQDLKNIRAQLAGESFDIMIHNAGIWMDDDIWSKDQDFSAFNKVFEVNSTAPLKVAQQFVPLLNRGAKFGLMSSRMGSVSDNSTGSRYGYRMSKAALNAAGKSMSIDLAPQDISVAVLHPGYVKTDMTNQNGLIGPDESAEGIFKVMDKLAGETTGQFWHSNGESLPR